MPFDALDALDPFAQLNPWWLAALWTLMLVYTLAVTWQWETLARWMGRVALWAALAMLFFALNGVVLGLSPRDVFGGSYFNTLRNLPHLPYRHW